jgi:hypothetical protein
MEIAELAKKVDGLERLRDNAAAEWQEARVMVGNPPVATLGDWQRFAKRTDRAVKALEKLTFVAEHLTAAAELEQALKEERWGDVARWSKALAKFEPSPAGPRYAIQYVGPDAKVPTYWQVAGRMAVTDIGNASWFADPIEAAICAPAEWYSEGGEARFTVMELA